MVSLWDPAPHLGRLRRLRGSRIEDGWAGFGELGKRRAQETESRLFCWDCALMGGPRQGAGC